MSDYHCPLWLVGWDYEEESDMGQTYEEERQELLDQNTALFEALRGMEAERNALATQVTALEERRVLCPKLMEAFQTVYAMVTLMEHIAAHSTETHEAARVINGQVHAETVDHVLEIARRAISQYDPLYERLKTVVPADEREARHEPPFAVLPEVY